MGLLQLNEELFQEMRLKVVQWREQLERVPARTANQTPPPPRPQHPFSLTPPHLHVLVSSLLASQLDVVPVCSNK